MLHRDQIRIVGRDCKKMPAGFASVMSGGTAAAAIRIAAQESLSYASEVTHDTLSKPVCVENIDIPCQLDQG
jgi:hypothetical protein